MIVLAYANEIASTTEHIHTNFDVGSWMLSAVALGLLALVTFLVRYWLEQQTARVNKSLCSLEDKYKNLRGEVAKLAEGIEKRFREAKKERNQLEDLFLRSDMHKAICKETQASFMLHVSNELKETTKELLVEIRSNREAVENLVKDLRKDLNNNGAIKNGIKKG